MKDALHPFGNDPDAWKKCIASIMSDFMTSQQFLMKLKLNSSGPGLFVPPHCHPASFTSSSEKPAIMFLLTSEVKDLNSTDPILTP